MENYGELIFHQAIQELQKADASFKQFQKMYPRRKQDSLSPDDIAFIQACENFTSPQQTQITGLMCNIAVVPSDFCASIQHANWSVRITMEIVSLSSWAICKKTHTYRCS